MSNLKIWDDYDKIKNMNDFQFNEMIQMEWRYLKRLNPEFCQALEVERNEWFEKDKQEYYNENDDIKRIEIKIREYLKIKDHCENVYKKLGINI